MYKTQYVSYLLMKQQTYFTKVRVSFLFSILQVFEFLMCVKHCAGCEVSQAVTLLPGKLPV